MCAVRTSLVLVVLSLSAAVHAAPRTLVFLTSSEPALDDRAVAEAVTIYTRDLGLVLEPRLGAPGEVTSQSLGMVIAMARSTDARLIFWYRVRSEGGESVVVLYGIASDGVHQTVHALRVVGASPREVYRVLALKVRAVLTGADDIEAHEPTPEPAMPAAPERSARVSAARPAVASATTGAGPAARVERAAPHRARAQVAVGYVATLPLDSALARHGIAVDAALQLGAHWELHLGVEVSSPASETNAAGSATLVDVPLRLGGRIRIERGRFTFAIGPLLSSHLLSLAATGADGSHGSAFAAELGLGGDLVGRLRLTDHVAMELRFWAEELLPDIHTQLHGVPTLEAGGLVFGLVAGARFAIP